MQFRFHKQEKVDEMFSLARVALGHGKLRRRWKADKQVLSKLVMKVLME